MEIFEVKVPILLPHLVNIILRVESKAGITSGFVTRSKITKCTLKGILSGSNTKNNRLMENLRITNYGFVGFKFDILLGFSC